MQHGPILVANNLFLSQRQSFNLNSQGVAFAHNLIRGTIGSYRGDTRGTPFHPAHATELAGIYGAGKGDSGDHRFYNNLLCAPCNLHPVDNSAFPCFAAGNVCTKGAQASKFDTDAMLKPNFDAGVKLTKKSDGWYLEFAADAKWAVEKKRPLVTTELLGKAKVPNLPYENADGSPIRIDTDYFGAKRDASNPFPGPFEVKESGSRTVKVWPKP